MNRSIRKSILVLSAFVSSMLPLLVASSTPARADAPLTFVIPTDFTFVEAPSPDTCSFPLEVHISGTLRITYFTGNTFREIMTAPGFRATYTNLDNGQSLTSVYPASTHVTWEEDGGVVYATVGLVQQIHVPGSGMIEIGAGRQVIRFDCAECPPEITQTGIFDEFQFSNLCAALQ